VTTWGKTSACRTGGTFQRMEAFVREYTAGLSTREIQRLFDRDAANAYAVLTREHNLGPEPRKGFRRFLFRVRVIFLGLSYKLTRRAPALRRRHPLRPSGLVNVTVRGSLPRGPLSVEFSPLWYLMSVGGLVFLLALELVDRIRVRDELEVARDLQAELLPRRVPDLPGFRFATPTARPTRWGATTTTSCRCRTAGWR